MKHAAMDRSRARGAVSILRAARLEIKEGRQQFICNAIGRVADWNPLSATLRSKVRTQLDGVSTMECWMDRRGIKYDPDSMRQVRLVWLDRWIEAIEKEYQL